MDSHACAAELTVEAAPSAGGVREVHEVVATEAEWNAALEFLCNCKRALMQAEVRAAAAGAAADTAIARRGGTENG